MSITYINENINNRLEKFTEKKKKSLIIGEKLCHLNDTQLMKRGVRMINCSTELNFNYCPDCGETHITKTNLCRDRLCPVCSWRLALKRYATMLQIMQIVNVADFQPAFLTLTVKNCKPWQLKDTIKSMNKAFSNITKLKVWKNIAGFAKAIEITYNKQSHEMHPHIHILLLLDKGTYTPSMVVEIKERWRRNLKIDYQPIIDLREIKSYNDDQNNDITGAVLETFKYTVKSKDLEDMPLKEFKHFAKQINGLRLISFGGILKDIKQALNVDLEELKDDDEKQVIKCKNCGQDLQEALFQWSFGNQYYKLLKLTK